MNKLVCFLLSLSLSLPLTLSAPSLVFLVVVSGSLSLPDDILKLAADYIFDPHLLGLLKDLLQPDPAARIKADGVMCLCW